MMNNKFKGLLALGAVMTLAACSSNDGANTMREVTKNEQDNAPSWVFNPVVDGALASSQCVQWSGQMQIDRAQVIAAARNDLAQQIRTRAAVLDKTYSSKTTEGVQAEVSSSFEQASQQLSSEVLEGSVPKEVTLAQIDGQKQLCALVVMDEPKQLFDNMMNMSGVDADPMSEQAMYETFMLEKTKAELEAMLK
ncbi:hypothetical protein [Pseudidiomarina woesei]|uniref:LPP20 lipoprotein n=1 Tax=Pseudidiomarina woesei TaxID=1381080 RepID=A0A0K6GYS7_9GAMM|nr:hypothetical protein [Pseudidiomarina woesei]CUA83902.1 hypothetical protein Ga0061064_0805 [Pseudidiomarina woesei]